MYQLQTATTKVVAALGVIALVVVSHGAFYLYGRHNGKDIVQTSWNADKLKHNAAIEHQKGIFKVKEDVYLTNIADLAKKVLEDEKAHQDALAAVNRDYAARLRSHEERASIYQRAARGNEAKRNALANHAAELDRTIVEGRQVVGELRATLGLREQQIQRLEEECRHERSLYRN